MAKRPRPKPFIDLVYRTRTSRASPSPPSSPTATEPGSPNLSPRKKSKGQHNWAESDEFHGLPEVLRQVGLCPSPTVSELAIPVDDEPTKSGRALRLSPTVSDFDMREPPPMALTPLRDQPERSIYKPSDDELVETADLKIPDESPSEEPTSDSDDSEDEDDAPVRLLRNFVLYDMESFELIPAKHLRQLEPNKNYGASGVVKAWCIDGDNQSDDGTVDGEEDENGVVVRSIACNTNPRVRLSKIEEFSVHHYEEELSEFDCKIYIRTKFAWYILDTPSTAYAPFFIPLLRQHQILHFVISLSLEEPDIDYDGFIECLEDAKCYEDLLPKTFHVLGSIFQADDVESDDVKAYLLSTLPGLIEDNNTRYKTLKAFKAVPLIDRIFKLGGLEFEWDTDSAISGSTKTGTSTPIPHFEPGQNKRATTSQNGPHLTVVTPIVESIVKDLFNLPMHVAGASPFDKADEDIAREIEEVKSHHDDPTSMEWGSAGEDGCYRGIIMDGVKYEAGDVVMVVPGEDDNKGREARDKSAPTQSANTYGNRLWFCQICYFFDGEIDKKTRKPQKFFHGQWLVHGSKTLQQETSHSKALYMTRECQDNPAACIFRKCTVKMMNPDDLEPLDDSAPDSSNFHCALVYDEQQFDFTDLPCKSETAELLKFLDGNRPCQSCALKQQADQRNSFSQSSGGFCRHGIDYHVGDCIYVRPDNATTGLLAIAQITQIRAERRDPDICVRYFDRHDIQERRLIVSETTDKIILEDVDGKCFIRHIAKSSDIEDWIQDDDHYFVSQKKENDLLVRLPRNEFKECICVNERWEQSKQNRLALLRHGPIRALELFAGAGGLGTGMNMSGFVDTRWAIELSPSAAATYQKNHPDSTVYCQDVNVLLKHAIEVHEPGKKPSPLKMLDGRPCKNMALREEVDFIYGGAPCQAFSLANYSRKSDHPRSVLPATMLSYVEHYQPNYFLLENVPGIFSYPLLSTEYKNRLEGGIRMGVVKLVVRTLISLGYQVRFKVLQAAAYGSPQGRNRVIFWGAKRGLRLPNFPIPTHAYEGRLCVHNLPTNQEKLPPATRSQTPGSWHLCAPLKATTVNDSIGDLPPFDWENPHGIIPASRRDKDDLKKRMHELKIPQFDAILRLGAERAQNKVLPGFNEPVEYPTSPQNRYQLWVRKGNGNTVSGHNTPRFQSHVIEASVSVPLVGNANHRDLPVELRPDMAKPGRKQTDKAFYGRLDGAGHFRTALTVAMPQGKGLYLLHPSQKRMITVRENARAQGFPDYYEFITNNVKDAHKQIGNAVPVPLALALGTTLGTSALLPTWAEEDRRGTSPEA